MWFFALKGLVKMKVLACQNYSVYRKNIYFKSKDNSTAANPGGGAKNDRAVKAYIWGAAALTALGSGVYVWKHKSIPKNTGKSGINNIIETPLPDEPLANSLPEVLRKKLSVNHNFDKFKSLISSPDRKLEIGSGANSRVYDIPFLPEYVLKILNPDKNVEPNRIPLGIFPQDVNLGQPVWIHPDNYKIILLKKVTGSPNSVKDWSDVIYDKITKIPRSVTTEQAQEYYRNFMRIAAMPQSSFYNLARQIQVLDTTPKFPGETVNVGFKTDCINPNNLLVDFKNNRLNIIDYFGKDKPDHKNSYMDMVAVISDFTLMPEFYDLMKPQQQKKFLKALKTLDEKCFEGAKKADLTTDKSVFSGFINETNKFFPIQSVKKPDGSGEYVRQYDKTAQKLLDLLASLN